MGITRRSLLQLMAGASAGVMVSPIPWKLLDDVSIWTQNWFLSAKLPRGETRFHFAPCGQCGGGCGLRVRTLGNEPISVTGQDNNPASHGGVCALGMASPELRFHPLRIVKPVLKNDAGELAPATPAAALARIGKILAKCKKDPASGMAAVLDWRPGSAMSSLYREFLDGAGGGYHIAAPSAQTAIQEAAAILFDSPHRVGYDFERTQTVLSLGAPLFEGFGSLGRMSGIGRRWQQSGRGGPRLIHADPNGSVTASMADQWLPIRPGTECALALSIGHVLMKQNLVKDAANRVKDLAAYIELVEAHGPRQTAAITGVDASVITQVARDFAMNGPAIAIAGSDTGGGPKGTTEEIAAMGLNVLTGNFGHRGGVVELPFTSRSSAETVDKSNYPSDAAVPEPQRTHYLSHVPNGGIRLLVVDGSPPDAALPWPLVQQKLAKDAVVVSLNPYLAGTSLNADIILPTAVTHEWEFDVPTAPLSPQRGVGISKKLCDPPSGLTAPPELVRLMARAAHIPMGSGGANRHLDAHLEAIATSGRGRVFDPKSGKAKPVTSFNSPGKLKKALVRGGTWIDDSDSPIRNEKATIATPLIGGKTSRVPELAGDASAYPFVLMPFGNHGEAGGNAMPQMMAKLYRESNLRQLFDAVHISPESAARYGWEDGAQVQLKTPNGSLVVKIAHDRTVMPGVLRIAVAPNPTDLGDVKNGRFESVLGLVEYSKDGVWRLTRASLEEVRHV